MAKHPDMNADKQEEPLTAVLLADSFTTVRSLCTLRGFCCRAAHVAPLIALSVSHTRLVWGVLAVAPSRWVHRAGRQAEKYTATSSSKCLEVHARTVQPPRHAMQVHHMAGASCSPHRPLQDSGAVALAVPPAQRVLTLVQHTACRFNLEDL